MITKRLRGFELISEAQWEMDRGYLNSYLSDVILPKRATRYSAGYDIFSTLSTVLEPREDVTMPLGWKVYMQQDECLIILPRSGMGFKFYARLANTIALIDYDYYNNEKNEGHCWLKFRNEGDTSLMITKGQPIAQGIFHRYLLIDSDDFYSGKTRKGGIGSTSE